MSSPAHPHALLFAEVGPFAGARFEIGAEATVGRDAGNTIVLKDRRISGRHCRFVFDEDLASYRLEDIGSRNGTFVDGLRVEESDRLPPLAVVNPGGAGDLIFHQPSSAPVLISEGAGTATVLGREVPTLPDLAPEGGTGSPVLATQLGAVPPPLPPGTGSGGFEGTILGRESPALPPALQVGESKAEVPRPRVEALPPVELRTVLGGEVPVLAPELVGEPAPAPGLRLRVRFGAGWEETFDLVEGPQEIGRGAGCRMSHPHQALSRHHARFSVEGDRVWLTDLGSTNGTFVDGEALTAGDAVEIRPGQRLAFGLVEADLLEARSPLQPTDPENPR
ncbi:MAG: FHA domain-containing protein [Acidobacteria bacterium]|nr:FHA domain-containing protein [Acidobacteriota bacterium]